MNKEKFLLLFKYLKWLDKFAYRVMSDPVISISRNDYLKTLLYLQIVKIHTTFGATIELIKKGYGIDAMILVRSMLNNLINCAWTMEKKHKTRAKKFIKYNFVIRKKWLDIARKYPTQREHFKRVLGEEKEIISSYKKVEKLFKKDLNKWSGITILQMAKESEKEWDYDFVYALASSLEHSDVQSLNQYVENIDEAQKLFKFRGGPSTRYINESGITAIKYMGSGLELFILAFKLKRRYLKRLHKLAKDISRALRSPSL